MTLGPDDLPPDPFADGAMVQVVCPCMTDAYHLVLDGPMVKLICPGCKQVQAVFPRVADTGPHRGWAQHPGMAGTAERDMLPNAPAQHTWTQQCDGLHPPGPCPTGPPWAFDPNTGTLTNLPGGGVRAGAGWGQEPPTALQEPRGGKPPPLSPAYPPDQCNIVLEGGPYHGQATWVMPDCESLIIHGYGVYADTGMVEAGNAPGQGKRVFKWAQP